MFRLDGRHAVVIGCGGIGAEIVEGLAAQGASLTCLDADEGVAAAAAARATTYTRANSRRADVLDAPALVAVARALADADILVLTAATNIRKPVLDYSSEEFDRVVSLNLRGTFNAVQAFAPAMAARGRGSIIALSSIRALAVELGQGVYAATKAGMVQLLRTLAAELGPQGVRVNASRRVSSRRRSPSRSVPMSVGPRLCGDVCPGAVGTSRGAGRCGGLSGERRGQLCDRQPVARGRRLDRDRRSIHASVQLVVGPGLGAPHARR